MEISKSVRSVLTQTLQRPDALEWSRDTQLLGAIPELDSMAVVNVITALEEDLGVAVGDDEITGETFETVGTLCDFVAGKMGENAS